MAAKILNFPRSVINNVRKQEEVTVEELKTKAWHHNLGSHFGCVLCGKRDDQCYAVVSLVTRENWRSPCEISDSLLRKEMVEAMLGDVCRDCIKAGPQEAAKRTLDYAKFLRERALELENLAGRVARITKWASLEDLSDAESRVGEAMRGGPVPVNE